MLTGPKWRVALCVDERATPEQAGALEKIFSGQAGGFWANLAERSGRRDAALTAVTSAPEAAICTASSNYAVLSHAPWAEILGLAEGGQAEARAALELALQMDAPPLMREAALLVARLGPGGEAEHARHLARVTGESLAAGLPDALGRSLIARGVRYL